MSSFDLREKLSVALLALCLTIGAFLLFRDTEQILDQICFHKLVSKESEDCWQKPPKDFMESTNITNHHQQVINDPFLDLDLILEAKLNCESRVVPTLVLVEVFVEVEEFDFCRFCESQWIQYVILQLNSSFF